MARQNVQVAEVTVHLDERAVISTREQMAAQLRRAGVSFEGQAMPISTLPTLVGAEDLEEAALAGRALRRILEDLLEAFVTELRTRQDGPLATFFEPYSKYFGMIATEYRRLPSIGLMRFDTVQTRTGWQFLETNTCCPGGVVHCARIRDAWLDTNFGASLTQDLQLVEHAVDSASGFVRYLIAAARFFSGKASPNIAVTSCMGSYASEVDSIKAVHSGLVAAGECRGQLILCDVRDIRCTGGVARVGGVQVDLIYNKLDPLTIDPRDPEIAGWVAASRSSEVEFLNSVGAMYLTEAKRVLALLTDPAHHWRFPLGPEARSLALNYIPVTSLLPSENPDRDACLLRARDQYVLKADALTGGAGVYVGKMCSSEEWTEALAATRKANGVLQDLAHPPQRLDFRIEGSRVSRERVYYGSDLFFFGDAFAGAVSRCHNRLIFNVASGGREAPTLVLR